MVMLMAIARKAQLAADRFKCEKKQIELNRDKSELACKIQDFETQVSHFDKNDPEYKTFDDKIKKMAEIEKNMDEQIAKIQLRLQLIEAEYGSCEQMIQIGIQRTFAR